MPWNKRKDSCGCRFLWMYKWLPDFCFRQACNIHDIEIEEKTLNESMFNFLFNMVYSIKVYNKYKILLSIVAIVYYIFILCFSWIFYLISKLKRCLK